EDLLAGVADLLWGEISPPEETASPTRNLGMLARSIRALFQRHPQAAPLLLRTYALSRSLLELMRRYLEALKRGDLGGRDRAAVLRSMVSYALGYGYTETSVFGLYCGPSDPAALPPAPTREEVLMYLGQALPPDTPPGLAETAKVMIADCNSDQCFEDGLELMLAALTQRSS
ncbi:MAG: TetR/AcrR family transcriptional regulator C-terminal domain-containing protein, partial [Anaerolineales bacterium]